MIDHYGILFSGVGFRILRDTLFLFSLFLFLFICLFLLLVYKILYDFSQPKAEWSARMGTVRLTSTSPWQQERRIVGMIKSPVEGSTTVLLKLDRPVSTFSDFVRPVCLPSNQDSPTNASHCNTLGWARNRKQQFVQFVFSSFSTRCA